MNVAASHESFLENEDDRIAVESVLRRLVEHETAGDSTTVNALEAEVTQEEEQEEEEVL